MSITLFVWRQIENRSVQIKRFMSLKAAETTPQFKTNQGKLLQILTVYILRTLFYVNQIWPVGKVSMNSKNSSFKHSCALDA